MSTRTSSSSTARVTVGHPYLAASHADLVVWCHTPCDSMTSLLQVSFYNMNPGGSWLERFASASRMFSKGRRVAIVEPYYKVMVDGLHGVRVDNPAEVCVSIRSPNAPS